MNRIAQRQMAALLAPLLLLVNAAQAFVVPPNRCHRGRPAASTTTESATTEFSSTQTKPAFVYTHLEINSMIWQIPDADVSILVDPIASQLDFGIAPLYRANKKFLSEQDTYRIILDAAPTHVLLSQGLDDHTHLPTIQKLVSLLPQLHYVVCPSAYEKVAQVVPRDRITVLRHGQKYRLNDQATVTATVGSLVGPPWQERENGYLLQLASSSDDVQQQQHDDDKLLSIYYEPHGDTEQPQLQLDNKPLRADICIMPVTEQSLPAQLPAFARFPVVHGKERMQEIVSALNASIVVPLMNGDLNTDGILSQLVASSGGIEEFEQGMAGRRRAVRVERPIPGEPVTVQVTAR